MNRICLFPAAVAMLLLCGCKGSSNAENADAAYCTIDISTQQPSEGGALKVARAIKLQTTEKSLISRIAKIISRDDRLYVLTQMPQCELLIFKADGTFERKITKGRANNELFYPKDISIDEAAGQLCALDYYRTVKRFSFDGTYLSQSSLSVPQFSFESVGSDGAFLCYTFQRLSKDQYTGYYGKEQLAGVYTCPFQSQDAYQVNSLMKVHQDSLLFAPFFSDTVYLFNLRTSQLDPCFVFDFHEKSANQLERISQCKSIREYMEPVEAKGLYPGPTIVHWSNGKLCFMFRKNTKAFFVYDQTDQTLVSHEKMFDELPNNYGMPGQNGQYLVYGYDIPWLRKHFEKHPPVTEQGKQIEAMCANEEDNPIVVFAEL